LRGESECALEEIARAEFDDLFERGARQAQRILRDRSRAEEISAEALGRLLAEGKERRQFRLIVHGLTVDAYRKMKREVPVMNLTEQELGATALSLERLERDGYDVLFMGQPLTIEQVEFRADFDMAVRGLAEEDRQAFLLTEVRGLTQTEAAQILHVDQTTVSRRSERARAQIKEAIA
jgi:RNA polymerase sigma factor (sigma-70 family)